MLGRTLVLPGEQPSTNAPTSMGWVDRTEQNHPHEGFWVRGRDDEPPCDGGSLVIEPQQSVGGGIDPRVPELVFQLFTRLASGGVITRADAISKFGQHAGIVNRQRPPVDALRADGACRLAKRFNAIAERSQVVSHAQKRTAPARASGGRTRV